MKKIALLFAVLIFCKFANAQSSNDKCKFGCHYNKSTQMSIKDIYLSDKEGTSTGINKCIEFITDAVGVPQNFILIDMPIENALALTLNDGSRYVIYDPRFLKNISNPSSSDWPAISILCHEIGHHLIGHTLVLPKNLEQSRNFELEADEFSGYIMFELGASLYDAQFAMNSLVKVEIINQYSTHPGKNQRLLAIEKGWKKAERKGKFQIAASNEKSAEFYCAKGDKFIKEDNFDEAIDNYSASIALSPTNPVPYFRRGNAKKKLENYEGALKDFNKTIELSPKWPPPIFKELIRIIFLKPKTL